MQEFYFILALLTAGVAMAMGTISFFLGFKHKNRTDLIFGLMCLSMLTFLLLPPVGFIVQNNAPYPTQILFKRIFIYTYYVLFPWFIFFFTNHQKRILPALISAGVVVAYFMMALTRVDQPKPTWAWLNILLFGLILLYGVTAGLKLHQHEKTNAGWFMAAMSVYGALFLLTILNQAGVGFMENIFHVKLFFSIHLHALFLVLIMGLRLVHQVDERYIFEKKALATEKRWQSLLQHAPVLIVELDTAGNLHYINPYGVKLLGYSEASELTGRNSFETLLQENERTDRKKDFIHALRNQNQDDDYLVRTLRSKQGELLVITWKHFLTYTDSGEVNSMICVGINTTGEEKANKLVHDLKLELEKEKFGLSVDQSIEHADGIIGNSEAIRYAIEKARQVAKTTAPVLLEGETGVGKELIADLIHKNSLRDHAPMVKVNCGALPKELIEDELFGHEKGAFTTAIQSRKGRFELADGGTIFLDEIGELPLEMQPKLLRVLQNGEFERVGGQKTIKVDVRIIAATNRELANEVTNGHFRDDLFYRLNVFPITIPPLRKRKEDLPLLINHFIIKKTQKYNKSVEQISKADRQRLLEYTWPGNVRELKNVIERSVIASEGNTLRLEWFADETQPPAHDETTLEQVERQHIMKIMEACHWKINGENGAAEKLNMHPNTLRSKMKKLGIHRPMKNLF